MEEYNKKLKQRIRKIREENNLSQQQVADELGISRNAFIAMEIGETTIINEKYLKFAQKYDKSFSSSVEGYEKTQTDGREMHELAFEYEKQKAEIVQNYENILLEKERQILELQNQIKELKRTEKNLNDYIDRILASQAASSTEEND